MRDLCNHANPDKRNGSNQRPLRSQNADFRKLIKNCQYGFRLNCQARTYYQDPQSRARDLEGLVL